MKRLTDEEALAEVNWIEQWCNERSPHENGGMCSRPKGHKGEHIACTDIEVIGRWGQESGPEVPPVPEKYDSLVMTETERLSTALGLGEPSYLERLRDEIMLALIQVNPICIDIPSNREHYWAIADEIIAARPKGDE